MMTLIVDDTGKLVFKMKKKIKKESISIAFLEG